MIKLTPCSVLSRPFSTWTVCVDPFLIKFTFSCLTPGEEADAARMRVAQGPMGMGKGASGFSIPGLGGLRLRSGSPTTLKDGLWGAFFPSIVRLQPDGLGYPRKPDRPDARSQPLIPKSPPLLSNMTLR